MVSKIELFEWKIINKRYCYDEIFENLLQNVSNLSFEQ